MDWIQVATIIGINSAMIITTATIIIRALKRIDADNKRNGSRLDGHSKRIDQLYQMFVDLLQSFKK